MKDKIIKALGGYTEFEYSNMRSYACRLSDKYENEHDKVRAAEDLIAAMEMFIYGKQPRDSKGRYVSQKIRKKELGSKLLEYAKEHQGKYKGLDITV